MNKKLASQYISIAIGIFSMFLTFSCKQDELSFNIGKEFIDDDSYITQSDTFTVNLSTVKVDSVATSGYNRILVGNYFDPVLESYVTASSYFQIGVSSDNGIIDDSDIDEDCIYDSVCLVLEHDGYYYGDTTITSKLKVYQLTQSYDDLDQSQYYQNNTLASENKPIGTLEYTAYPQLRYADDEVLVKLDDDWGELLFNHIVNRADSVKNNNLFLNYYKGFLIQPDSNNISPILGYDVSSGNSTPSITIYYHKDNSETRP